MRVNLRLAATKTSLWLLLRRSRDVSGDVLSGELAKAGYVSLKPT